MNERFWAKVEFTDTCWLWTAAQVHNGYGRFSITPAVTVLAHRFAYEFCVDTIPEGLVIDHLCRVRHCVNPDHMEVVTMRENTMRGDTLPARNAAKTHCKRGHAFDEANTAYYKTWRICKACKRNTVNAINAAKRMT